ncbi:MAG: metallophosphoesterase [Granulosicoccus sp.]
MTDPSTTVYRQIPLDPARRYLIIGDLHGRFNTLKDLLDVARYRPEHDVLMSIGDLIDRGPRSVEVVDFFATAERYAIRGNHEQMVLNPEDWREVWNYPPNGGPATRRSLIANNRDLGWLYNAISDYPVCLDIGTDDEPDAFRLVHAEQPFDWSEAQLQEFLETSSYLTVGEGRLLWGRDDIEAVEFGDTPALHPQRSTRRSFCGHTPLEAVTSAHNTYWIDTFEAGTLSCIDALTLEDWSVPVRDDEFPA